MKEKKVNLFSSTEEYFESFQGMLSLIADINTKGKDVVLPLFKELLEEAAKKNEGFHYKANLKLPENQKKWYKVLIRVLEKMFGEIKTKKQIILE